MASIRRDALLMPNKPSGSAPCLLLNRGQYRLCADLFLSERLAPTPCCPGIAKQSRNQAVHLLKKPPRQHISCTQVPRKAKTPSLSGRDDVIDNAYRTEAILIVDATRGRLLPLNQLHQSPYSNCLSLQLPPSM